MTATASLRDMGPGARYAWARTGASGLSDAGGHKVADMLAAIYTGGEADGLEVREVPTPEPATGEVRVRITVSGVNPTDWKSVRRGATEWEFAVPNQDGAGVIDAVGDGVDPA